jgi:hypothetical protein
VLAIKKAAKAELGAKSSDEKKAIKAAKARVTEIGMEH